MAAYSLTGSTTNPNWIVPDQIAFTHPGSSASRQRASRSRPHTDRDFVTVRRTTMAGCIQAVPTTDTPAPRDHTGPLTERVTDERFERRCAW